MADASLNIGKLVPGFDFLQGLAKNAGAALPAIGQWIAPTLNPEELAKRIEELRTVQFWLEQNARMLGATIQALEVQRMTLSTLKTMNVPVSLMRDSLQAAPSSSAAPAAQAQRARKKAPTKADATAEAAAVDPMQWWGALTKQFTTLATQAMKDTLKEGATEGAKTLATSLVKQSFNAAEQTLKAGMAPVKKATAVAGEVARTATGAASQARRSARRARSRK
jgi:hypothetical protein